MARATTTSKRVSEITHCVLCGRVVKDDEARRSGVGQECRCKCELSNESDLLPYARGVVEQYVQTIATMMQDGDYDGVAQASKVIRRQMGCDRLADLLDKRIATLEKNVRVIVTAANGELAIKMPRRYSHGRAEEKLMKAMGAVRPLGVWQVKDTWETRQRLADVLHRFYGNMVCRIFGKLASKKYAQRLCTKP